MSLVGVFVSGIPTNPSMWLGIYWQWRGAFQRFEAASIASRELLVFRLQYSILYTIFMRLTPDSRA